MKVVSRLKWDEEKIAALTPRARAGDQTAVDLLIDAYIPAAMKSAAWYVKKAPKKMDDIFAAGLQGLVTACHRSCNGHLKDDNIEAYIKSTVRWAVQDFLRKDFLIPIPPREFKRRIDEWAKNNENTGKVYINADVKDASTIQEHGVGVLKGIAIFVSLDHMRDDYEMDIPTNDRKMDAVNDLFVRLGLDNQESVVASLRMDKYTLQEIGDKLGFTKMRIKQICDKIKIKIRGADIHVSTAKISGTKVCTTCKEDKSLSDFYKRSDSSIETHKSICKACMKAAREAKCTQG